MADDFEAEQTDEYTRLQMNIQRGDGVDRRGDVTVEIRREKKPEGKRHARTVELPDGNHVRTAVDEDVFAEFYAEVDRSHALLVDQLGLDRE